jgi:anthranilate phosphoribosyltransferase
VLVHAEEGLDELGLSGPSQVTEFDARTGEVRTYTISPGDVGLEPADVGALAGGDVALNSKITLGILAGESGPPRDAALLNAGAGIYAADAAPTIADGVAMAAAAIASGRARESLQRLVALTQELAREEQAAKAVPA